MPELVKFLQRTPAWTLLMLGSVAWCISSYAIWREVGTDGLLLAVKIGVGCFVLAAIQDMLAFFGKAGMFTLQAISMFVFFPLCFVVILSDLISKRRNSRHMPGKP